MKAIQIYNKQDIYKATDKYVSITQQMYKDIWNLRKRIKFKTKLVNNIGMQTLKRKPGSGRNKKRDDSDIPSIIYELNEEQKKEILEIWIKEQRDKKKKEKKESIKRCSKLSNSLRAKIVLMHRSTFTKKPKTRIYKFDWIKEESTKEFNQNKGIYMEVEGLHKH